MFSCVPTNHHDQYANVQHATTGPSACLDVKGRLRAMIPATDSYKL